MAWRSLTIICVRFQFSNKLKPVHGNRVGWAAANQAPHTGRLSFAIRLFLSRQIHEQRTWCWKVRHKFEQPLSWLCSIFAIIQNGLFCTPQHCSVRSLRIFPAATPRIRTCSEPKPREAKNIQELMLLHQLQPGAPALVPQALNLSLQFMDAGHQFLVGSLLSATCRDCGVAQIKIEGHTRKSPQHVKKFPPVKLPNLRRHRSLTVTDLSNSSTLLSIWFSLSPWHSTSSSWQNSDASSCPIQSNQLPVWRTTLLLWSSLSSWVQRSNLNQFKHLQFSQPSSLIQALHHLAISCPSSSALSSHWLDIKDWPIHSHRTLHTSPT